MNKHILAKNRHDRYVRHQQFLRHVLRKSMRDAEYDSVVQLVKDFIDLVVNQSFIKNESQFINIAFEFNLIVHTTDSHGHKLHYWNFTTLPHNNFEADQIYVKSDGSTDPKTYINVKASKLGYKYTSKNIINAIKTNDKSYLG